MTRRLSIAPTSQGEEAAAPRRESVIRNLTAAKSNGRRMSLRKLSFGIREIGYFKDLCLNAQTHNVLLRREASVRRLQEINRLREAMDRTEDEELMDHFNTEALAAVINQGIRTTLVKSRIMSKIGDEKELSNLIQAHRDEFLSQVWTRRLHTKRELRAMFKQGANIMHHLGDMISTTTQDLIQATERNNAVTLLKDGIAWDLTTSDDTPGVISKRIFLLPIQATYPYAYTHPSRLDFGVRADPDSQWYCVRAARGLMRAHSYSRPLEYELVMQALRTAERARDSGDTATSFLQLVARTVDLVHPGQNVLADVLAYPMYAAGVLRRKLGALGYDVAEETAANLGGSSNGAAAASTVAAGGNLANVGFQAPVANHGIGSALAACTVLNAMARSLRRDCLVHLEFTVPAGTNWRVGVEVFRAATPRSGAAITLDPQTTPGMGEESMGISYDGMVYSIGLPTRYPSLAALVLRSASGSSGGMTGPTYMGRPGKPHPGDSGSGHTGWSRGRRSSESIGVPLTAVSALSTSTIAAGPLASLTGGGGAASNTYGLLLDFAAGSMSLVIDGFTLQPPAFGMGATHFPLEEQERQWNLIQMQLLVPMFALQAVSDLKAPTEMRVNFGMHTFAHNVDATSANDYVGNTMTRPEPLPTLVDDLSTLTAAAAAAGNANDEDERVQLALEKNYFRAAAVTEDDRSWSQFPPSVYKRSLAATKIQRVWRIFRGRRWRRSIIALQTSAVVLIQRVARRKLARMRAVKNLAALIIQRNWRIRLYLKMALMRMKYQRPITELHQAARMIQNKFRDWAHFRNSPFASRFRKKLELLSKACIKIQNWWRPRYKRLADAKAKNKEYRAAVTIQRLWRGYSLRTVLRPDIRLHLSALGKSMVRHRASLLKLHAALRIQNIWREYRMRRVRAKKIQTRHAAATRLQALWKGYWIRSHIHLRFDYGESVFLSAVGKNLRAAHFILKMYKPCGIVCPKRDR
ncbi:hypothetical protein BC828DRAFT_374299 [Blastocladiella britannica]|nr:hypothetical protein BC828DRAFT_374299 [Blastocladiella britannica]